MELICLGSSSKGNGYILKAKNGESLIIEAGVPFYEYKKALNFKIKNLRACLISHMHGDHFKYVREFECIDIYSSKETFSNIEKKHNHKEIEPNKLFNINEFKIIAFDVPHDVRCYGYMIYHEECGNVVFITDCAYSEYTFKNVNNWLIECNYSLDILNENAKKGIISEPLKNRTIFNHMSYNTCLNTLKSNDLSFVNNIVLLHLSGINSNKTGFINGIANATNKKVHVATKDLRINFDKTPF